MSFTQGMYRRHLNRQRANPYGRTNPSPFGERFTRRGEVMVTRQQLGLLQSLYDAPHHTFPSITKWVEATVPRLRPTNADKVRRGAARVPEIWVTRTRFGNRKLCALQARGRAIVEGTAPAWLIGEGRIGSGTKRKAAPGMEGRPSRGQLLDRLDGLYWRLIESRDGQETPAIERKVVDHEVELSVLEAERQRNIIGGMDRELLEACRVAVVADDLQPFLQAVGTLSSAGRSEALRLVHGFHHWWQRFLVLEEVVLAGEIERYGLALAAERRQEYRRAGVRILEQRLEVLT